MHPRGLPVAERFKFYSKPSPYNDCILWVGTLRNGYGKFRIGNGQRVLPHRYAYEQAHGPIPAGLVIDHLCRTRNCVEPAHLEAVTSRANILRGVGQAAQNARKTHCLRGHPFEGDNLYTTPKGKRFCIICRKMRDSKRARYQT